MAQDVDKAEALFTSACAEKEVSGCNGLALVPVARAGWPDKWEAIKKSLETKCKANDAAACYSLAIVLETGQGKLPADMPRAKELLKKACDGKNAGACLEKDRLDRQGT